MKGSTNPVERATALLGEVRLNLARLEACRLHVFELMPNPKRPDGAFGRLYRCSKCLGEIDWHAHYWYAAGRAHGGRSRA